MSKEQQGLLDEVYRKYADSHKYFVDGWLHVIPMEHSKETFVNECKTNPDFSEKWGLKIEERELTWEERQNLYFKLNPEFRLVHEEWINIWINTITPTKLITITYNDKTIESYE